MKRREFIIDCDTGTDDAIAIMAALYSPEIRVRALTSVNGNVKHSYTSRNNLNLVEYLGMDEVEVARGAELPLYNRGDYYGPTHGSTGLGSVELPEAKTRKFSEYGAPELIYKNAKECAGELEILAIGPLTNLAITLSLYPEIKKLIKHIWIMGGAVTGGNMNTTAEFNIWVDPIAAKMVFNSGIPITMVGLDTTLKAMLNRADVNTLRGMGSKAAFLTADLTEFMLRRHSDGGEDALMHDALALAAALSPDCLSFEDYFVDVECNGEYTTGHTAVDVRRVSGRKPNASVAVDIDLEKFKDWLMGCLRNSIE